MYIIFNENASQTLKYTYEGSPNEGNLMNEIMNNIKSYPNKVFFMYGSVSVVTVAS